MPTGKVKKETKTLQIKKKGNMDTYQLNNKKNKKKQHKHNIYERIKNLICECLGKSKCIKKMKQKNKPLCIDNSEIHKTKCK